MIRAIEIIRGSTLSLRVLRERRASFFCLRFSVFQRELWTERRRQKNKKQQDGVWSGRQAQHGQFERHEDE